MICVILVLLIGANANIINFCSFLSNLVLFSSNVLCPVQGKAFSICLSMNISAMMLKLHKYQNADISSRQGGLRHFCQKGILVFVANQNCIGFKQHSYVSGITSLIFLSIHNVPCNLVSVWLVIDTDHFVSFAVWETCNIAKIAVRFLETHSCFMS